MRKAGIFEVRKAIGCLAALFLLGAFAGCGGKSESTVLRDMDVEKYVTLGDYKGLEVEVASYEVDEDEVQDWAWQLYSSVITEENGGITDRAVEDGDTVIIDYTGTQDGEAFDGGSAEGANLTIGAHEFIDGFEDGLIGVMPGETVELNLTFPEDYWNEDMAGAEVVFTVTVHYILPEEMTDDSVITLIGIEDVNTIDELLDFLRNYIQEENQQYYENDLQSAVLEAFMKTCEFKELPKALVEEHRSVITADMEEAVESYNSNNESDEITLDEYVQMYSEYETFEEFLSDYVENTVKQAMALQAVANRENLNVSDEALDTRLSEYAAQAGYESVEEFVGDTDREDFRDYFVDMDVLDFLADNAVVVEPEE